MWDQSQSGHIVGEGKLTQPGPAPAQRYLACINPARKQGPQASSKTAQCRTASQMGFVGSTNNPRPHSVEIAGGQTGSHTRRQQRMFLKSAHARFPMCLLTDACPLFCLDGACPRHTCPIDHAPAHLHVSICTHAPTCVRLLGWHARTCTSCRAPEPMMRDRPHNWAGPPSWLAPLSPGSGGLPPYAGAAMSREVAASACSSCPPLPRRGLS